MTKKESFVLYTEQKAVLDKLTDEQAGKLIKAIYEYEATGIMPELDSVLDIVITPFKTSLDKNNEKWEEVKQKRIEAGKLGAEKRWKNTDDVAKEDNAKDDNQDIAKIANAKSANSKIAKMAVNVNVNGNVNVNEDISSSNSSNNKEDVAKIDKLMVECLNTTNINNIMECVGYLDKIPIDLIEYGLRKTARKQFPSWQYAMTILDDYVRKKFITLEQVKADELSYKSQKQPKEETEEEKMQRKIRELKEACGSG